MNLAERLLYVFAAFCFVAGVLIAFFVMVVAEWPSRSEPSSHVDPVTARARVGLPGDGSLPGDQS